MAPRFSEMIEEARLSARALLDYGDHFFNPTVRLGVTGLSRAGKTVFITALIHGLTRGGRFPVFEPFATGRIAQARLAPQPDDAVPRFDYENHVRTLIEERRWPNSTVDISELRLVIDYQRKNGADRTLTLDIVDYPGEWLLDLPLLNKSYEQWSHESLGLSRERPRAPLAAQWHAHLATLSAEAHEDEQAALTEARLFTDYLGACRDERFAMSLLPPGRFLMPGDLDNSPALTFSPLNLSREGSPGSLARMMARRYEAYKSAVVRPFFREHFARLDRQIVLADVLTALNAGPAAIAELEMALAAVLASFRLGRTNWLNGLVTRKIDRILFAATKADHLHHGDHDRLEAILGRLVARAAERAKFAGAKVDVLALASVRATREASVTRIGDTLPSIIGTPLPGETIDSRTFDGATEAALFPGDLPTDTDGVFKLDAPPTDVRFVRFRPPRLERTAEGLKLSLPHIRLDRALEFLLGDKLA